VARTRLLSGGLNCNNRLEKGSHVTGDQACLACGNCVDACPVVAENQRFVFVQNLRTSMSLENFVGEACRRCYRCINACPQVDKELKEYASAYRRGEKIIHFIFSAGVILMAASGITMSHYKGLIPTSDFTMLSWIHKITGMLLLIVPVIYFLMDRRHLKRSIHRIFSWRKKDIQWIGALFRHIGNHRENQMPLKVQFNAGQKLWYLYSFFIIFAVMSTTGIIQWLGPGKGAFAYPLYDFAVMIHLIFAFVTDCLILVHVYLKYLRKWMINVYEIVVSLKRNKHLIYPFLHKDKSVNL
jgi:cytochrome b subunit of formate dehydrogenase